MRIVFFIQNMSRAGGSERVCSLIANYLSRNGHDITILSICGNNKVFFDLDDSIVVKTLIPKETVDNRKEFVNVIRNLYSFYKDNSTDVVIDVFPALSIYTIMLKKKFRYKNISWEHYNFLNNSGMNKVGRKLAGRFSDRIITLTETDKELYLKNLPCVYGKIESIFNPTPYPDAVMTKEKERIVLAIGRLEKQKGFHHLLDIWKKVETRAPDLSLYIIGEGEERDNLEQHIKINNIKKVVFTGRINNVNEYYQRSMLLVSTSEHEGLPMTMIEAQSFALPIVSYDYMTGPRDIITEGVDGFIVPSSDQNDRDEQMANRIIELMTNMDKYAYFSNNAWEHSKRFSMNIIGKQWDYVLTQINHI